MSDELTPAAGIDRRELLKRGALVGGAGALLWAAPSVTRFANPAFGQTEGTPREEGGKDFSYIALRYDCGDGVKSIKFEFEEDGQGNPVIDDCETGDFQTPFPPGGTCNFQTAGSEPADCTNDKFTISFPNNDLSVITICIEENGCLLDGVAVGKCGSNVPQSGGECQERNAHGLQCITFDFCGN